MKFLSLPSALCLALSLTACATPLKVQTEPLPASLRQRCPDLPLPPSPLIDPPRAYWEEAMIRMYGECAARHFGAGAAQSKHRERSDNR